ncbi:hypothetical protein CJI97_005628 [Candidozyma auris]|nr:hypothetical protein CJI97_005628 [[Candida] auris]
MPVAEPGHLEEKNFKIRLNVIDTPGFGNNVNNLDSWTPIIDFIDDQHEAYVKQEKQPIIMKRLSTRVNLIPVIAKADTLSPSELEQFKIRIRDVIEAQDINIYTPPMDVDDPASAEHSKQLIEAMPFAVIGSKKRWK